MKKLYSICVYLFFCVNTFSQVPKFEWVKVFGGNNYQQGISTTLDAFGNVYSTGTFSNTTDFDPGSGTFTMAPSNPSYNEIFILKLDSIGNFIWAKQLGAGLPYSIKVDYAGNVCSTGLFYFGDSDPGPGVNFLNSSGLEDIFVSKLDANGNFIFGKLMGGFMRDEGIAITTDIQGNIYSTGWFRGPCDFDPGLGSFSLTPAGGGGALDVYISKLDPMGNFIWAKNIGGIGDDLGASIVLDAKKNIYVGGRFGVVSDFDPNLGTYTLSSKGGDDAFLLKLDSMTNFKWVKQIGGPLIDCNFSIALDALGGIYTTGNHFSTSDFDPSATNYTLTSNGWDDIFVTKYDTSGNFLWAKQFGGTDSDQGFSIAVDNSNNVYTTGYSRLVCDFDPGPGTFTLAANGTMYSDVFVSKLDAMGNFIWAREFGSNVEDIGRSIAVYGSSAVYTLGYYWGSVVNPIDFDPGPGTYTLTSNMQDVFVHKMSQCSPPASPTNTTPLANQNICQNNNTTLFASSTATINWFATSTSTTSLATGTTYITPTLSAGSYTYYAEAANSCSTSISRTPITVTVNSTPTLTISGTNPICLGNSTSLIANGASTFTWSTGPISNSIIISPTITTTYSVIGTSTAGCQNTKSISVIVNPNPTVTANTSSTLICVGQTATLTSNGANTYSWSSSAAGSTTAVSPTTTTNYSVTGTDINGCTNSTLITQSVSACVNISELSNNNGINIFPNPTNGQFILLLNKLKEKVELKIINEIGQIVLRKTISSTDKINLDISDQASGVYFVEVNADEESYRAKIIKE